ncbi:MAG: cytochrome P450 [Acidimicrobiales bacterium]
MTDVLFDPTRLEVQVDPYPHYRRLRDEAPVYFIEPVGAYALTRYEDCKNTFLHPEQYSARDFIAQAFGDLDPVPEVPSIIAMDPPEHTRLRKLAAEGFKPSITRAMEPKVHEIVDGLIDDLMDRPDRSFDFVGDFAAYVPVSVTAEMIGVDASQRENFKHWTADLLNAANRAALADDEVTRIRASVASLREYLETVIADRRANPTDDFISMLVRAEVDEETLSPLEVLSVVILTHFGGSETPSHLIGNSLIALFEEPDLMARVKADLSLVPKVVEESLRFWSPVHLVFQTAAQEIDLHGVTIPENSFVLSYISSANRDERRFPNPDVFDIDRNTDGHLSFAHGPHYCPGASIGRRMAAVALTKILERMPDIARVNADTDWLPTLWIRGARTLPVTF